MTRADLLRQASALAMDEQIDLVEAIWDGIASANGAPPLSDAQRDELDQRLARQLSHPDDCLDWAVVKAEVIAKARQ
ncbi:MAG: addiction module protein [Pseudomonadota bacterium]